MNMYNVIGALHVVCIILNDFITIIYQQLIILIIIFTQEITEIDLTSYMTIQSVLWNYYIHIKNPTKFKNT